MMAAFKKWNPAGLMVIAENDAEGMGLTLGEKEGVTEGEGMKSLIRGR